MTADPPLFRAPPAAEIAAALERRVRRRVDAAPTPQLADLVADTLFHERKRLERDDATPHYADAIEAAAQAVRSLSRPALEQAVAALVRCYAYEIHNPFSVRTYRAATRILPGTLTRLLSGARPRELLTGNFDPASRIVISGPLETLRRMAAEHTLILAPTHVSNLDSPLIGYAAFAAGLPPFAYGAGLNLFSNPAMAFFMQRLGAYTVDRRKRNRLYKDTLKDYSVEVIGRRHHSLFFPGGTRSRSGRLETRLKKGLLGTGLAAWQESLAAGRRDGEVFVVPCTLSIGLVLEAETLIADALAEEGKQRYIITDDEFSDARTVASFVRSLMRLDAKVHVVFGAPMDVVGNPVDAGGVSLDPGGRPVDRRGYVTAAGGQVVPDEQRDHLYTERVAQRLSEAYQRDFVPQSTHVVAFAAWEALRAAHPGLDTWRLVRLHPDQAVVPRGVVSARVSEAMSRLATQQTALPSTPEAAVDDALRAFASFHRRRAVDARGGELRLSPELLLYYQNRMVGYRELR